MLIDLVFRFQSLRDVYRSVILVITVFALVFSTFCLDFYSNLDTSERFFSRNFSIQPDDSLCFYP
jgi:hypothetical protein